MTTTCVLCPVYWPNATPEPPEHPPACDLCRGRLAGELHRVDDLYRRLPDVLEPGSTPAQRVSGSREPKTPIRLGVADLLAPVARLGGIPVDVTRDTLIPKVVTTRRHVDIDTPDGTTTVEVWERTVLRDDAGQPVLVPAGDQTGNIPVAQVLDSWVRDWLRERPEHREHRPTPRVSALVEWLNNRLRWAVDDYTALVDFAHSLRHLTGAMRAALGETEPAPERCRGVPCRSCDFQTLFRRSDGTGDVDCRNPDCRRVYRRGEYDEWARLVAAHSRRDPQLVADYTAKHATYEQQHGAPDAHPRRSQVP